MDGLANIAAFVRVVENGGFTAAARHLSLSTTMVSNHVQELEDRLGARLLNRTTRKVSLTEIGREYYERILAELDEADRTAGALQATPRGRLRVHCHPALARFIAPVVTAYLRDNPEVSVEVRRGDQMADLLEEEFDLAIRTYVPPDSSLMMRRLAGEATLRHHDGRKGAARELTPEAMDTFKEAMADQKLPWSGRIAAAIAVLDRGWASQRQALDANLSFFEGLTDHERQALLAVLEAVQVDDRSLSNT